MKTILLSLFLLFSTVVFSNGNKSLMIQESSYEFKSKVPKRNKSFSYSGGSEKRGMGLGMITAGLGFILHGALVPNNSVGMVNTNPRVSTLQMPNKIWSVSVGIILTTVGIVFTF